LGNHAQRLTKQAPGRAVSFALKNVTTPPRHFVPGDDRTVPPGQKPFGKIFP
jgi:hypothetical protein